MARLEYKRYQETAFGDRERERWIPDPDSRLRSGAEDVVEVKNMQYGSIPNNYTVQNAMLGGIYTADRLMSVFG